MTEIYSKNGEFHSDPICTHPVQNFLMFEGCRTFLGMNSLRVPEKQGRIVRGKKLLRKSQAIFLKLARYRIKSKKN